jgi:hypothetical protein
MGLTFSSRHLRKAKARDTLLVTALSSGVPARVRTNSNKIKFLFSSKKLCYYAKTKIK